MDACNWLSSLKKGSNWTAEISELSRDGSQMKRYIWHFKQLLVDLYFQRWCYYVIEQSLPLSALLLMAGGSTKYGMTHTSQSRQDRIKGLGSARSHMISLVPDVRVHNCERMDGRSCLHTLQRYCQGELMRL